MYSSELKTMTYVIKTLNGFNFKVYERIFAGTRTFLIRNSLVKTFKMQEIDVVRIAGGRCENIFCYLRSNNLDSYYYVTFCGGNGLPETVQNGRIRGAISPTDTKIDNENYAFHLHNKGIPVFVVGIPKCRNTSWRKL